MGRVSLRHSRASHHAHYHPHRDILVEVFIASAVLFMLAVLGMSVGTIFGRQFHGTCRGTCGNCESTPAHKCDQQDGPDQVCEHHPVAQAVKMTWGGTIE